MGLESANYVVSSAQIGLSQFIDLILCLGGKERQAKLGGTREFVINGDSYWIDVQWLLKPKNGQPSIFIRVALCNPMEVGVHLRKLFEQLFKNSGTIVSDTRSKTNWSVWNDNVWNEIWGSYQHQRNNFRNSFGDYEAAISAEDVFKHII